ncbi:MAG: hypothetical protein AAGD32_17320 [Planctomycetota bacterium]
MTLSNRFLTIRVALPDTRHGFNRASRFDRAGMVVWAADASGFVAMAPHTQASDHDPAIDDHVAGTAGEFSIEAPPGYNDANPGETFLKIGVGLLERTDDRSYRFRHAYPIRDAGQWQVESGPTAVTLIHELSSSLGWAYRYRITVRLYDDRAGFEIERQLENLSSRRLAVCHYSHNFVWLDGHAATPGARIAVEPPHRAARPPKFRGAAEWKAGTLSVIDRPATPGIVRLIPEQAQEPDDPAAWSAVLSHPDATRAMTISQVPMPDRTILYLDDRTASIEPFIDLDLLPGASASWRTAYEMVPPWTPEDRAPIDPIAP